MVDPRTVQQFSQLEPYETYLMISLTEEEIEYIDERSLT